MNSRDIENRADIESLVHEFYGQATKDELIGHFFTEVMRLNWDTHIPLICDFWETILLNRIVYKGNPMLKHLELHKRSSLLPSHFERWLTLWKTTVSARYAGPTAQMAVDRATQIAELMKFKVQQL